MQIRYNWGVGLAVTYSLFALSTAGFVVFAMSQPVSLVSPRYYEESLREDERQEAVRNARAAGPARVNVRDGREVVIALPDSQGHAIGTVTLYRASDAAADQKFTLRLDAQAEQHLAVGGLPRGAWVVQVAWRSRGRPFYVEAPVVLR
jgi:nitrogen fixation protein FixH